MTVYYDADRVQPGAFPALLAIGDSWFWYPFVSNLLAEISAIVKPDYSNILTLGQVGATLEQFATGRHAPQLARQLRPQNIIYYSALLVSGGGNDAVDWGLCLKSDCTGLQTAGECLDSQQLADNLACLDVSLPPDALARLDQASHVARGFPHDFLASTDYVLGGLAGQLDLPPGRSRYG